MTLTDWREQRATELHQFRGKVDVITDWLARGSYTPAEAVRELRNADAEVERRFAEIDKAWQKELAS